MENKQHVKFLMYAGTLFLTVLSILAIAATIFVMKGNKSYDENTISVSGTAEVNSTPDIAHFSFVVKETSKTNKEAQDVISRKVTTILDGLEKFGIKEKDIKTQSYNIYPKYEYVKVKSVQEDVALNGTVYYPDDKKQVQVGFDVSQDINITLRDFDKVGDVLELLATTGVDNLNGPNFQIENPDQLQEQAREKAIADTKAKAKRLAKDLGVRLGKVVSFNEGSNGGFYPQYALKGAVAAMDYAGESFAPSLPIGENTVSSNVTIVYKIK